MLLQIGTSKYNLYAALNITLKGNTVRALAKTKYVRIQEILLQIFQMTIYKLNEFCMDM